MFKKTTTSLLVIFSATNLYAENQLNTNISMNQKLEKLESYNQINNLMGRFIFLLNAARFDDLPTLFALKRNDVRSEMAWGVYEGENSIRRLYTQEIARPEQVNAGKGQMNVYTLTTPVIEVDRHAQTAKGVWVLPSVNTGFYGSDQITANWGYTKYGADFIKEDGEWKIWHLHQYGIFLTPYEKSWTESQVKPKENEKPNPNISFKPDRPSTTHWGYSTESKTELLPAPPKAYNQFDNNDVF